MKDGDKDGHKVKVMRDTGSTTYVVKQSFVDAEQMTGNYELCMLIDGVVKRFPTAIVKINTPYYKGTVKALCMENPVQELIVGNISGATGVEACYEAEVVDQSEVIGNRHEVECETQQKQVPVENGENEKMSEIGSMVSNTESSEVKQDVIADEENHCATVQTRAMKTKEEIAKVQKRNRTYYNRRARERKLNIGDSVLLLLPTENTKLTLAWRGPYEVVKRLGEVDYRVTPDKIKTYHINMLKKYHQRKEQRIENDDESENISESEVSKDGHRIEQVAAIACVIDDGIIENSQFEIDDDKELLPACCVSTSINRLYLRCSFTC